MNELDIQRILSESPQKRLLIQFNKMKEDFTEQSALEYKNYYSETSLSFILENSRLIFSEPYYGYDFYKNIICGKTELCVFTKYEEEYKKLLDFVEEITGKMPVEQLEMYQKLVEDVRTKIDNIRNTIKMAEFANDKEDNDNFELELSNALYEYINNRNQDENAEKIRNLIGDSTKESFFIYTPYVNLIINDFTIIEPNLNKYYNEPTSDDDIVNKDFFKPFAENVILVTKLYNDKAYQESVSNIRNADVRFIFEGYATESLPTHLEELFIERVSEIDTCYVSPEATVNNIFDDFFESELYADDNSAFKNTRLELKKIAYDTLLNSVMFEYQNCDDITAPIYGYSFFNENTSIGDAMKYVIEKVNEVNKQLGIIIEEKDDSTDSDFDEFEKKMNASETDDNKEPKKANAPKAKNLANKIQFKAMDAEVKQRKSMAKASQKGQEIKNAAKAVSNLPLNVVNNIQAQIKQIDSMDDDRRKKFMVKPGFRKKIFRNLKLALMYGSIAQIKLAYIPLAMIGRHMSKEKDRRIRNDVLREIDTEIKICDEKINDASSAGDNDAKYSLMRIKAKLETERLRVRTNSKYI